MTNDKIILTLQKWQQAQDSLKKGMLNEANNKFLVGNPISGGELNLLIDSYRSVVITLEAFNERRFDLFESEMRRRLDRLVDMKEARNEN